MPSAHRPPPGIANPYGTYLVEPTENGLRFQVSVWDPRNNMLLLALLAKSAVLALLTYSGLWLFLGALVLLMALDALLYLAIAKRKLAWIEVRPDGLAVTPDAANAKSERFFDRRAITHRVLDYDQGLTFRYGIFDITATPGGFCNEREFEIFESQFEQAIARLWHHQNL